MQDIRELNLTDLESYVRKLDDKPFRANQIYEWIWKKSVDGFEDMLNLPVKIRNRLTSDFSFKKLIQDTIQISSDGTQKIGFRTHDKKTIEGVLIPTDKRITACISSQTGCSLNCLFCATARISKPRNLSAGEIFDQVFEMEKRSRGKNGNKLSNIVLMGMGEPLLNYNQVSEAINKITADYGLGYSPRRITLSTAGINDMIRKMGDDGVPYNLAISLHTTDDRKRSELMPVNKSNPVNELRNAIRYFYDKTGLRITYEYLLLNEFNDSLEDALSLAEFCKISPCKINLIEYNEVEGSPFTRSDTKRMNHFQESLASKNLIVNIRKSRGADIDAACGQLAGKVGKSL